MIAEEKKQKWTGKIERDEGQLLEEDLLKIIHFVM
jgi:hypothetical protein